jgi:hypothetical protein
LTSSLNCHCCLPILFLQRECHLEAVFHVFAYLGLHHSAIVVFDPTYPSVDMGTFINTDWKSMSDAPVSRGKEVDLRLFVDSDHAGEKFTRRSRTGLSYT